MSSGEPVQRLRLSPQPHPPSANLGHPSYLATSRNDPLSTYKIKARPLDPFKKQYFILWGDVQAMIKDAEYAVDPEDGALIPFMVDESYEVLVPRRIIYHPHKILDVVTLDQQALSKDATQNMGWLQSTVWPVLRYPFYIFVYLATFAMVLLFFKFFSSVSI